MPHRTQSSVRELLTASQAKKKATPPTPRGRISSSTVDRVVPPTEASEHEQIVKWLRSRVPSVAFFHPPNGGKRSKKTAFMMQRMGLSPGVPDLMIITPPPNHHPQTTPLTKHGPYVGTALEIKRTGPSGRVSPEQRAWHAMLTKHSWYVAVVKGYAEAVTVLKALGY